MTEMDPELKRAAVESANRVAMRDLYGVNPFLRRLFNRKDLGPDKLIDDSDKDANTKAVMVAEYQRRKAKCP